MMAHIRIKNYGDTNKTKFIKDGVLVNPFGAFLYFQDFTDNTSKEYDITHKITLTQKSGYVRLALTAGWIDWYFNKMAKNTRVGIGLYVKTKNKVKKITTTYFKIGMNINRQGSSYGMRYDFYGAIPFNYPDGRYDFVRTSQNGLYEELTRNATIEDSKIDTAINNYIAVAFGQVNNAVTSPFNDGYIRLSQLEIHFTDIII